MRINTSGGAFTLLLLCVQAQTVEFPEGYYAFYELAERMSAAGRQVECAPELRQSIALVRLKPRSWEEARSILEDTLSVRFQPLSGNRWRLERDPTTVEREQRLRARLAKHFQQRLSHTRSLLSQAIAGKFKNAPALPAPAFESRADVFCNYHPMTPDHVQLLGARFHYAPVQRWRRLSPDWSAVRRSLPVERLGEPAIRRLPEEQWLERLGGVSLEELGMPAEMTRWAQEAARWHPQRWQLVFGSRAYYPPTAEQRAKLALLYAESLFAEHLYLRLTEWAIRSFFEKLPLNEVLDKGRYVGVYSERLESDLRAHWLRQPAAERSPRLSAPVSVLVEAEWRNFWPSVGTLSLRCIPLDEAGRSARPVIVNVDAPFDERGLEAFYRKVAPAYAETYRKQLQRQAGYSETISSTLNAFVSETQKPENFPHNLTEWLRMWASAHDAEVSVEVVYRSGLSPQTPDLRDLQGVLTPQQERMQWLLDRVGSVWTLRYPVGFVDRTPRVPLPAAREFLRSERDYAACLAFYRSLSLQDAVWFTYGGPTIDVIPRWLGAGNESDRSDMELLREFGRVWLVMHILTHLPEATRAPLIAGVRGANERVVSLSEIPADAQKAFAQSLREWFMLHGRIDPANDLPRAFFTVDELQLLRRLSIERDYYGWSLYWEGEGGQRRDLLMCNYPRLPRL